MPYRNTSFQTDRKYQWKLSDEIALTDFSMHNIALRKFRDRFDSKKPPLKYRYSQCSVLIT